MILRDTDQPFLLTADPAYMIQNNVDLKAYNTFGIQSIAKRFATFSSIEELNTILQQRNGQDLLVLGGGSNILFTKDFDGLVIRNEIKGFKITKETEEFVQIKTGAGEVWHEFVLKCIDHNFGGVENLSLIPGSVGASPIQNIGAYGTEIKDVFVELEAFHIERKEIHTFDKRQCAFGYRESVFEGALKNQYIITSVTFQLTKKHNINSSYGGIENELSNRNISNPTIKDISDAVIAIRSRKLPDPREIGNAGSFFKNPVVEQNVVDRIAVNYDQFPNSPAPNNKVKLAAGWLIDQAGWKGKTFETYGVHKNHALVLVNYSNSLGSQIFDLSTKIVEDVQRKFGVTLEREVIIV